jgi:uncharacterized protein YyaL (SSP411 family)
VSNRLAHEKSPYLLQHAHNPVDWFPWGEEAFARARQLDRPIFLSVGYSTCHWCHVMERESFENAQVAAFLNASFVSIKVDREERPDVDRIYMGFVQATTGSGGWPMSVWLTPERAPFYGGTYFPPRDAYGRPSFLTVLEGVAKAWADNREEVLTSGSEVLRRMAEINAPEAEGEPPGARALAAGAAVFKQLWDEQFAGFGSAPKFPRPVSFMFLEREAVRSGDAALSDMCRRTLLAMGHGGMYDQLGGGFHRYSVDREWHVPHFEKMLYDEAQLVETLAEAHAVRPDAELARLTRETVAYVERDLGADASGAFHAAEDADSALVAGGQERAEGAFYVWTDAEFRQVTGVVAEAAARHFGVLPAGNANDPHGELTGKNILHIMAPGDEQTIARARAALFAARSTRPRPHLDDKILGAWNALMIRALAVAAGYLGEPAWVARAVRAAHGVLGALWDGRRLARRLAGGEVGAPGQLDDHAALVRALVALYEATFDPAWLATARAIADVMDATFWDTTHGGWFASRGDDPSLALRLKDDYDGAEPSGTSLAILAALELGEHTDDELRLGKAARTLATLGGRLGSQPHAMPLALVAADWQLAGPTHVVIAGAADDARTQALATAARRRFMPRKILILADEAARRRVPWLAGMEARDGVPCAYVCRNRACELPVIDPAAITG